MAKETQYTANTSMAQLTTKDSGLDGTNAVLVLTGASSGTFIKTVTIKAFGHTSAGMVRLFVYHNGGSTKLLKEVSIPAITYSSRNPSFETTVHLNYYLEALGALKATTDGNDNINVIAEGLDWAYYGSIRPESTKYTAHTEGCKVSIGNSSMIGQSSTAGDVVDAFTGVSPGSIIQSIIIKAQVSTTPGMIRLFLDDKTNIRLFKEIPVPSVTKAGDAHSFSHRIDFEGRDFALEYDWKIKATTQNSEAISIIVEALDWAYPA